MNDKGCDTCKHCKEHEYTYECTIGRATECHWMNSFRLWQPRWNFEDEYDSCSSSTTSTSSSSSWVPPEEHEEFSEEDFNVR